MKILGKFLITHVINLTIKHIYYFFNFFLILWTKYCRYGKCPYGIKTYTINQSFFFFCFDCTCFITIFFNLIGRGWQSPLLPPRPWSANGHSDVLLLWVGTRRRSMSIYKSSFVYRICRVKRHYILNFMISHPTCWD